MRSEIQMPGKFRWNTVRSKIFALAGNPNVGKSTVFNGLTGLNQHTGNWTGKTVENAWGICKKHCKGATVVDLPGCYSLFATSREEEIAGDFICSGGADATVIIADGTNLKRNLILLLQTLEISNKAVLGVNLLDEAKKHNIKIDLKKLSCCLGIETVGIVAKKQINFDLLMYAAERASNNTGSRVITYSDDTEKALQILENAIGDMQSKRFESLKLLQNGAAENSSESVRKALELAYEITSPDRVREDITQTLARISQEIYDCCVTQENQRQVSAFDKLFCGKYTAVPLMCLLLLAVFWLTVKGANYPSQLLGDGFSWLETKIVFALEYIKTPTWLLNALVFGVYRTVSQVVSVMLPPMAIFFPLFTLLEDLGYLPRVAFNLDGMFARCNACGKQSLTMCMGLGCNAVGVTGCRIIDSPRERLVALLTNSFMPCNGRFPMIIAVTAAFASVSGATVITLFSVIALGILATFLASMLLSKTLLKGSKSSFVLEIPPIRRPQIAKTLVRSVFDRTLHVLGRAVCVAAPMGLLIYVLANTGGFAWCSSVLDPIGRFMGIDGVILFAFILALPANEIVLPIILMGYLSGGFLGEAVTGEALGTLLVSNGWTVTTAVCTVLFCVMHWPCSTTLITVYKETKSLKWTAVSAILPTAFGVICCVLANLLL